MRILAINDALRFCEDDTVLQYDLFRFISCLQGHLNREKPELFLLWLEHDTFWLDYMTKAGKFLHDEPRETVASVDELLTLYGDTIRGLGIALWDPAVPAQSAIDWMRGANPGKKFHIFRTILVSPTNHDRILGEMKRLAPERNIELLDPITFFSYLKTAVENGDTY